MTGNFTIRDEIRDYWSDRAASFDNDVGHEIFSEAERHAWHDLIRRHLGAGGGRTALDLASGTGVVSHLLDDLGFKVTGIDWAEPMLERARAKARARGTSIRFIAGDAERTMEPAESVDVIVTRHLVWTLVDPLAAFRDWHAVLKPGGRLLIIDGDFVNPPPFLGLITSIRKVAERAGIVKPRKEREHWARHLHILSRVHFRHGARADEIAGMLRHVGFRETEIDKRFHPIHSAQARGMTFMKSLERRLQHRYAVVATK